MFTHGEPTLYSRTERGTEGRATACCLEQASEWLLESSFLMAACSPIVAGDSPLDRHGHRLNCRDVAQTVESKFGGRQFTNRGGFAFHNWHGGLSGECLYGSAYAGRLL